VCILVYDITYKKSFDEVRNYWILQVKEYAPKDASKKNIYI
jgi:GTPase SAR1 family protein